MTEYAIIKRPVLESDWSTREIEERWRIIDKDGNMIFATNGKEMQAFDARNIRIEVVEQDKRRNSMEFQFSAYFLGEIVFLAKEIAYQRRGQHILQDEGVLADKYDEEMAELQDSDHPEEELPDLIYYALSLAAQGAPFRLCEVEREILPRYPYTQKQLEAATLAKYRLRAAGPNSKDFAREREAIKAALASAS